MYENKFLFDKQKPIVLESANYICTICKKVATEVHHLDGSKCNHSFDNLIAICKPCHSRIHTTDRNERSKGKLNIESLENLIIKNGLNKSELARSLGMRPSSLSIMLKRGSTYPKTIRKLSEILNCSIDDILSPEYQRKTSNDGFDINICANLSDKRYNKAVILAKEMHTNLSNSLRLVLMEYLDKL